MVVIKYDPMGNFASAKAFKANVFPPKDEPAVKAGNARTTASLLVLAGSLLVVAYTLVKF